MLLVFWGRSRDWHVPSISFSHCVVSLQMLNEDNNQDVSAPFCIWALSNVGNTRLRQLQKWRVENSHIS